MSLQAELESLAALPADKLASERVRGLKAIAELRSQLNSGAVRAAAPSETSPTGWQVNAWVKQGILLGFRLGALQNEKSSEPWSFFDKDTIPVRQFRLEDSVRIVPGGTTVRDGAFLAPSVIVMPPAYVNIGAYVG